MTNPRMPAAFIGHGTPMNALATNAYTEAWRRFGAEIPKPRAILAISAHWYTHGIGVTAMEKPRTIHDFGGFPAELFAMQYPAPGSPELARRVQSLLSPLPVTLDRQWGLDHGVWSILVHMFPRAEVPVAQLSIDAGATATTHYELGKKLTPLRDEGILVIGAGNVVHNLGLMRRLESAPPLPWAEAFNQDVRERIQRSEHAELIDYESLGEPARLSVPTPEHYLPLLYILGMQQEDDEVSILVDGIDLGAISMLSIALAPREQSRATSN